MSSFFGQPVTLREPASRKPTSQHAQYRCLDFLAFLAICFEHEQDRRVGLHPVLTNWSPSFDDVSMGGYSFEVRKVKSTSFPHGLQDELFKNRDFVAVKHPRIQYEGADVAQALSELATELQILRFPPLRQHGHIVDFLGVMYHDAGTIEVPNILPALVIEYAALGSVKDYQANGYGKSYTDKISILLDTAKGLEALHACGIIHGDIKPSNLLVCKHATRPFIVKLTDFGFSLLQSDTRITGFTSKLEAPEASEAVDPYYYRQLDIYSYGILVHTVFKDGTPFFESLPEEDREENVKKLKVSNLLVATAQLNLLQHFRGHSNAGLIPCKILAYSLQKSPAKRFKSMSRILELFLVGSCPVPTAPIPPRPELKTPLTAELHEEGKVKLLQHAQDGVKSYCASFTEDDMPLKPILESELTLRVKEVVDLCCKSPDDWDGFISYVIGVGTVLQETVGGLAPEARNLAGLKPAETLNITRLHFSTETRLHFSTETMPDFPRIAGVIRKCPAIVQERILSSLQGLANSKVEDGRKHRALLGLAWAYAEGFGVDYDVHKSLELVQSSANMGNLISKQMLLELHHNSPGALQQEPEVVEKWLQDIIAAQVPRRAAEIALSRTSPSLQSLMKKAGKFGPHTSTFPEPGNFRSVDLKRDEIDACYSTSWKDDCFSNAIINDDLELAHMMLDEKPFLISQTLGEDLPLMLACRFGSSRVAKMLLERQVELLPLGSPSDVQPQHWLFMFEEETQEDLGRMMVAKRADLNSWVLVQRNATSSSTSFSDLPVEGSPLHWALVARSLSAVSALLKLGANPLFRFSTDLSAFEFACSQSYSEAVSFFLKDERVQQAASVFVPLDPEGSVLIQPLFRVVNYESRWSRLIRNGINFEDHTKRVIKMLVQHGSPTDAVLKIASNEDAKMPAALAVAYHDCSADILRSGLEHGFGHDIDSTFGRISSGGTPLFLSISHRNRDMFTLLLEHNANPNAIDMYKFDPVLRACKETDDTFYIENLVKAGAKLNRSGGSSLSAFSIAVHTGNFKVAKYLYDHGFDRDEMFHSSDNGSLDPQDRMYKNTLGSLLYEHTRSAERRIQFLLSLPDSGSDGFIVMRHGEDNFSALHFAVPDIGENPDDAETARLIMSTLLQKYNQLHHINNTDGPHRSSVIAMAVEVGNHKIVRALLNAGADPNIEDEYGRLPLDQLYWRYCYPATTAAMKAIDDIDDRLAVKRTLDFVNGNTSEIMSLLTTHSARTSIFQFPEWFREDSGYRGVDWVIERLKENRERPRDVSKTQPVWGNLAIRIPEHPMQFRTARRMSPDLAEGSS